jgi:hypothetical protein
MSLADGTEVREAGGPFPQRIGVCEECGWWYKVGPFVEEGDTGLCPKDGGCTGGTMVFEKAPPRAAPRAAQWIEDMMPVVSPQPDGLFGWDKFRAPTDLEANIRAAMDKGFSCDGTS